MTFDMLSDTLLKAKDEIEKGLNSYSSGTIKNVHGEEIIAECQDIINRIKALCTKLESPDDELSENF